MSNSPAVSAPATRHPATGFVLALLAAMSFSLSGTLGTTLMRVGWSPAAAVTIRVSIGALVMLVPAALALRGQWHTLRTGWKVVVAYGVIAVAACQLFYFLAVERMPVAVALLTEYTSPVGVLIWLWLRHGQRPTRLTVLGAVVALTGLALVIDVFHGLSVDPIGVLWALGAMVGAVVYFILSADESHGVPPMALAGGGLIVGAVVLLLAGLVGIVPFAVTSADTQLGSWQVPWWVPALGLGVVCAAVAYTLGIRSSQLLGSRLASFVALLEVIFAVVFAWVFVGQAPTAIQALGGAAILLGVVLVKVGEPREPALSAPLDEDGLPVL